MQHSTALLQEPAPGQSRVCFCGDVLTFTLTVPADMQGAAWVRTNIGHADVTAPRSSRRPLPGNPLGRDWFDTPCGALPQPVRSAAGLSEVGHFEAKCFFLTQGETTPIWPPGANTSVNVEPAESCCATPFTMRSCGSSDRTSPQRGPARARRGVHPPARYRPLHRDPPSGTFGISSRSSTSSSASWAAASSCCCDPPTPTTYAAWAGSEARMPP